MYEKFKSVISASESGEFSAGFEEVQQLFASFLGSSQCNWWDYVVPRLFLVCFFAIIAYRKLYDGNKDNRLEFHEFVNVLGIAWKGTLEEKFGCMLLHSCELNFKCVSNCAIRMMMAR